MKKKLWMTSVLSVILMFALAITGCQKSDDKPAPTEAPATEAATEPATEASVDAEEVSLSEWNGVWNNYLTYFDEPILQKAIQEQAEKEGVAVEDLKKQQNEAYGMEFAAMQIEDGKVVFLDQFKDRGGKPVDEATYVWKATHTATFGEHEFFWFEFGAEGDAKYPVLLLTEVHGEESLTHYHVRYGSNAKEMLANENWYPTLVRDTTTPEQVLRSLEATDHDHDHDHDHHDHDHDHDAVSMQDWEGAWNNMGAYLDEEELQTAFEQVAEKEGKSAEEVKKAYVEKRKCDFDGFVVRGEKVTLLDGFEDKDGNEMDSAEYRFVKSHKVQHGSHELEWHAFQAEGDAKYPVLLMMEVHGEENLVHFHMRYGDDIEALLAKDGWYPTFIKPGSTMDQLIEEITE